MQIFLAHYFGFQQIVEGSQHRKWCSCFLNAFVLWDCILHQLYRIGSEIYLASFLRTSTRGLTCCWLDSVPFYGTLLHIYNVIKMNLSDLLKGTKRQVLAFCHRRWDDARRRRKGCEKSVLNRICPPQVELHTDTQDRLNTRTGI